MRPRLWFLIYCLGWSVSLARPELAAATLFDPVLMHTKYVEFWFACSDRIRILVLTINTGIGSCQTNQIAY